MPCRAGYGLCSGASSSSRSQPSSGQPATRQSQTPRFVRPSACHSRAGSAGAACSCAGRPGTRALVGSRLYCAGSRALASALTCAPGRAGGRSPARSRSDRAARSHSGARCRTASRLAACSRAVPRDALCSAHRRAGAPTSACSRAVPRDAPAAARARTGGRPHLAFSRPARRSAPAATRARTGGAEVQGEYAPKSLAQLVGAWAYSAEDCERLFRRRGGGWAYRQPVDKFAQAAIVESPKRILLPSAACRVERASEAKGALKVQAECADSISYTSRSLMIGLRSATQLVYSPSGDPALATTLKKCAP